MMLVDRLIAGSPTGVGSSDTGDAADVICVSGLATLLSGLDVSLVWASTEDAHNDPYYRNLHSRKIVCPCDKVKLLR